MRLCWMAKARQTNSIPATPSHLMLVGGMAEDCVSQRDSSVYFRVPCPEPIRMFCVPLLSATTRIHPVAVCELAGWMDGWMAWYARWPEEPLLFTWAMDGWMDGWPGWTNQNGDMQRSLMVTWLDVGAVSITEQNSIFAALVQDRHISKTQLFKAFI